MASYVHGYDRQSLENWVFSIPVSLSLATVNVDKTGVAGESVPMICDLPLADPPVIAWKDWVNNMNREAIEVADEAGNINQKHPERDNFQVSSAQNFFGPPDTDMWWSGGLLENSP